MIFILIPGLTFPGDIMSSIFTTECLLVAWGNSMKYFSEIRRISADV